MIVAWQMIAEFGSAGERLIAEIATGAGAAAGAKVKEHFGGFVAFEGTSGAGVLFAGRRAGGIVGLAECSAQ